MAAARTHLAYSVVFTPSGGSAWTLTDLADVNDSEAGNITELTTDNSQVVNGMFGDSLKGTVSASSKDLSHRNNAGAAIHSVGSLVVKYGLRTAGKGFTASNYLSITYASAILETAGGSAGVTGEGTFTATWRAYGTDGTTVRTVAIGA